MRTLSIALFLFASLNISSAGTKVLLETTSGEMTIELNDKEAPVTVRNFLEYVQSGHYRGLVFHRVIEDFVIQGGGHLPDMTEVPTGDPIINEANNGLSNARGTIAMARKSDPHSATAQFYINVKDNLFLDYVSDQKFGYCVFGQIIEGLEIVDIIRKVETETRGEYHDVPKEPIIIIDTKVLN